MRAVLIPAITNFLGGLRFRNLFLVAAGLFVVTLFTPIPLAEEILVGLVTLLLSRWKSRDRDEASGAPGDAGTGSGKGPSTAAKTGAHDDVIDLPRDQVRREG